MAKKSKRSSKKVPGTIYKNGSRYWWKVRLPGSSKTKSVPLVPQGAKQATPYKDVAIECAKLMWSKAVFDSQQKVEQVDTIAELVKAYLEFAQTYYIHDNGREIQAIKYATKQLVDNFADLPIEEFGPRRLKDVREFMIEENLSRRVINSRVGIIRRMFKWAVSEQIASPMAYHALGAVDGLRRGYTNAREVEPVRAIDEEYVYKVLPYASDTIAAMIELQLLTGMRPCELTIMRPCDITKKDDVWHYRPQKHKNSFRGLERIISIGPRGQEILRPFLLKKRTDYCFSPQETENKRRRELTLTRKTPLSCGNRPGTNRKAKPQRAPRDHYDTRSYGQAVKRAINTARREIKRQGGNPDEELPKWTPYQLRHTAATKIRKVFNYETAGALLGHSNLSATQIYAERNQGLADMAAQQFG
ncbi:site-specific tyrosine recombinase XerC [Anaerohalosphaera lusitana]|uniref:Site-specific tyrosine recombinase XerC n=1 Tax=Anaerohalosphaera lusitana TaxID=1936003 RepID=A0A1U9NNW5_9BACT|nr:site-specific integrase [Anaerohalosphaera lusitana]AQT69206.1 site-specific tyrosine recombinase XerC [Anaerohalosphaera lusitana]